MSPAFYAEKMQHAIRVFMIPLNTVAILGVLFNYRLNLPRSTRSFQFLPLNCCKYLRHSGHIDHVLWQRRDHQSDHDVEHQFSPVELDGSG